MTIIVWSYSDYRN